MATFITHEFLKKVSTEGRLIEAMDVLENLSEKEKEGLPSLPKLSSWECVLEEVLDTDHSPDYYARFVNELLNRGYSKADIQKMRMVAWETAGWLNFEMMLWDWCSLSESDMRRGLKDRYRKKDISKERYNELNDLIDRYKQEPNNHIHRTAGAADDV